MEKSSVEYLDPRKSQEEKWRSEQMMEESHSSATEDALRGVSPVTQMVDTSVKAFIGRKVGFTT